MKTKVTLSASNVGNSGENIGLTISGIILTALVIIYKDNIIKHVGDEEFYILLTSTIIPYLLGVKKVDPEKPKQKPKDYKLK